MTALSISSGFERSRWVQLSDWLAVAVAVSLPWSTSATVILIVLWLAAALPASDAAALRRAFASPAGYLPVALCALAALGMLWADATWAESFGALQKFLRVLLIPLLLAHFQRSERGVWVLYGFLASMFCLLLVSWGLALVPGLPWRGKEVGIPVKDHIFQSTNFVICAFGLLGIACAQAREREWRWVAVLVAIACLFLANIGFVTISRTALVVAPALLLLLGWREFGWKGLLGAGVLGGALAAGLWFGSIPLRNQLIVSVNQFEAYPESDATNSTALRLEFFKKALLFVQKAPIIGHGTGSIPEEYREAATGQAGGVAAELSHNPHNQILAVAIQLGLLGVAILVAMWIAHLLLFRGPGLYAYIGLVVVVQNIVASAFNSHLFDFTSGWLYVFGVGVIGGTLMGKRISA
jgi:O-antigen ligase